MPLILVPPETQFIDANGTPYAGGKVYTYIPGTDTPKNTWVDNLGDTLNENPLTLDAAGRCLLFGDGDYRLVLYDATGNLVYDQWTSSVVSDAMQPVVAAATIADAVSLLGISGMVQAETNRAEAAESTLQTNINNETTRAEAAEATLTTNLNNEISRAEAAEANLQSQITGSGTTPILPTGYSIRFGSLSSGSGGAFSGSFSPAFPTACTMVVASSAVSVWAGITSFSASGFSGTTSSPLAGGSWAAGPYPVNWIAIGH